MILDGLTLFDTLSAVTSTQVSANTIPFSVGRDMGVGDEPGLKLLVLVGTTFTTTNSATLQVQYQTSTDNSTFTTLTETPALAASVLVAGARLFDSFVPRNPVSHKYARLNYVVGTGIFSAGTVTAAVVLDKDETPIYPAGITIAN